MSLSHRALVQGVTLRSFAARCGGVLNEHQRDL